MHGIIEFDKPIERDGIMTTFKEYAAEHPTIQIDDRLNDMEIADDVRELLELHNQFDGNVVEEFEMGDCTYAKVMYFDDHTVGVVATTGGIAPVEVVGLFGDKPVFFASAPDTYDRTTYEPQRVKGWSDLCGRLRSDTWDTVHWEYRVEIGDTDPGDTPYDYELARNVTFADGGSTPEERVDQFLTLGQVALDANYRIQHCPDLDDHITYTDIHLGLPGRIARAVVDSKHRPFRDDYKRSEFQIIADINSTTKQLAMTRVDCDARIALPVGVKVLTDTDEKAVRTFISDAISDIVNNPIIELMPGNASDIVSDLDNADQLTQ